MKKIVTDTSEMNVIFVHSALDDAELSPVDFRIYCHLSRRAGSGTAFPAAESIAKVCKINRDTVWASLARLEARGMVERVNRQGTSNVYLLTKPSKWKPSGKEGVAERRGLHPAETKGLPPSGKEGPLRISPLSKSKEGNPLCSFSKPNEHALPDQEALEEEFPDIDIGALARAHSQAEDDLAKGKRITNLTAYIVGLARKIEADKTS